MENIILIQHLNVLTIRNTINVVEHIICYVFMYITNMMKPKEEHVDTFLTVRFSQLNLLHLYASVII